MVFLPYYCLSVLVTTFNATVNERTVVAPDWICSPATPVSVSHWYPPVNSIGDHESPQMLLCYVVMRCGASVPQFPDMQLWFLYHHTYIYIYVFACLHLICCSLQPAGTRGRYLWSEMKTAHPSCQISCLLFAIVITMIITVIMIELFIRIFIERRSVSQPRETPCKRKSKWRFEKKKTKKKRRKRQRTETNSRIRCSYPDINAYKYTLSLV